MTEVATVVMEDEVAVTMTRDDVTAVPIEAIAEKTEPTVAVRRRATKQENEKAREKRDAAAARARLAVSEVLIHVPFVIRRGTRENFQLATPEQYAEVRSLIPKLERVLKAMKEGRRRYRAKPDTRQFTAEEIREIRTCYERGAKFTELSAKYGVNKSSMRDMCIGVTYRDVDSGTASETPPEAVPLPRESEVLMPKRELLGISPDE